MQLFMSDSRWEMQLQLSEYILIYLKLKKDKN